MIYLSADFYQAIYAGCETPAGMPGDYQKSRAEPSDLSTMPSPDRGHSEIILDAQRIH